MKKHEHHLFLVWLIISGVISFLLLLGWHQDILHLLFATDRSKISVAIVLLYAGVTIHCAVRSFYISSELNCFKQIEAAIIGKQTLRMTITDNKVKVNGSEVLPDCLAADYIHDLITQANAEQQDPETGEPAYPNHIECYQSKLRSPHEMGWFIADIMIKMGLLGTIIGFIFMLASVSNITDFDVTSMQKILGHMSAGMGTALYTTMAGLVCSAWAALQYQILDRGADDLITEMRYLTQVYVLPSLR